MKIENFYRDTKQLGFGEYRFRRSEAAAYTRAPSLSGLYSPRNSQAQTDFVQDNQDNAINGVCYNMGQEESKTWVRSLHM